MTGPARIRQDCLKGSGHLGTKCACCSEAINSIYQTCQSDRAWCASRHISGCNTDPAFLVCIEWTLSETVLNGYAQSSAYFPCTWGKWMRHSFPYAALRFNSLANFVVCVLPAILSSYDRTINLGVELPNEQLNRNARPFIPLVFDQSRKFIFFRLMITRLFHRIFLSRFFLLWLPLRLHILDNLWTEI